MDETASFTVLIAEDEPAIADTLIFALQKENFVTMWVDLAAKAITSIKAGQADLLILDVGLPDMSGFEACKQIRTFSDIPVMFLTARSDEIDRVVGLEIGADDYVTKPFSPREVTARVKAILKRLRPSAMTVPATADTPPAAAKNALFHVDTLTLQANCMGHDLTLTPHEFRLLTILTQHPRRVFSREQLLDALGIPCDSGYERNVDSHIKDLRAKIRATGCTLEPIQTHRGFGYSYAPPGTD